MVDMFLRLRVNKVFGKTHVNDVTYFRIVPKTHQKVVRLDVSVDEVTIVHLLKPFDKLVSKHNRGFKAEPPPTELK